MTYGLNRGYKAKNLSWWARLVQLPAYLPSDGLAYQPEKVFLNIVYLFTWIGIENILAKVFSQKITSRFILMWVTPGEGSSSGL